MPSRLLSWRLANAFLKTGTAEPVQSCTIPALLVTLVSLPAASAPRLSLVLPVASGEPQSLLALEVTLAIGGLAEEAVFLVLPACPAKGSLAKALRSI